MPYIQFLGAAGTVTGSKHLINTSFNDDGKKGIQVLIDCGLWPDQPLASEPDLTITFTVTDLSAPISRSPLGV